MSFEVQFYIDCQNVGWYTMNARHDICRMLTVVGMVEMIGIRNDECPRGALRVKISRDAPLEVQNGTQQDLDKMVDLDNLDNLKDRQHPENWGFRNGGGGGGGTSSLRVSRYAPLFCPPFSASGRSFCPLKFDNVYHFIQILLGPKLEPITHH